MQVLIGLDATDWRCLGSVSAVGVTGGSFSSVWRAPQLTLIVAEVAVFSAQTGRLLAVLIPAASMPGHGSPCQVLWTDLSGAHLIAYCGTGGVVNGTRFTPVNLHVPDTSGTDFGTGIVW